MAHHSADHPHPELQEAFEKMKRSVAPEELRKVLETAGDAGLGPTGRHPEPQLGSHDEGEIRFGVAAVKDDEGQPKVVINFASPVHFVGMSPEQACELGRLLITRAGRSCTIGFG